MKDSFVITSKYEEWALVFVYNETNQNQKIKDSKLKAQICHTPSFSGLIQLLSGNWTSNLI